MSISSEIIRIGQNIADSLAVIAQKGVTVLPGSNSDDLPTLINEIEVDKWKTLCRTFATSVFDEDVGCYKVVVDNFDYEISEGETWQMEFQQWSYTNTQTSTAQEGQGDQSGVYVIGNGSIINGADYPDTGEMNFAYVNASNQLVIYTMAFGDGPTIVDVKKKIGQLQRVSLVDEGYVTNNYDVTTMHPRFVISNFTHEIKENETWEVDLGENGYTYTSIKGLGTFSNQYIIGNGYLIDSTVFPMDTGEPFGAYVNSSNQLVVGNSESEGSILFSVTQLVEPPGATLTSKTIVLNGTYTATDDGADGYSDVIVNVREGGSPLDDVVYYDYDGTIVTTRTVAEVQQTSSQPALPAHSGLSSQGWTRFYMVNDGVRPYATTHGHIDLGATYRPTDNKTRLYCKFEEGRTSPYLGLYLEGTAVIDWGDGSAAQTVTGSGLSSLTSIQHVYESAGEYTITIQVTSGGFIIKGNNYGTHLLRKADSSTPENANDDLVYSNALTRVVLGSGLILGARAFSNCGNMETIVIPNTITSIGNYAFNACYNLKHISIPASITSIGEYAFQNCRSLKSVAFPKTITQIGAYAFSGCYALKSATVPDEITTLNNGVFRYCYGLEIACLSDGLTDIPNSCFDSCALLSDFSIPYTVTAIGQRAFYGCSSLKEIGIPDSVAAIGIGAFQDCTSLRIAEIPSGSALSAIYGYGFSQCSALSKLIIPEDVTYIGDSAFSYCRGLGELWVYATTPPTITSYTLDNLSSDCIIYVPFSSNHSILNAYKAASYWSSYASQMVEMAGNPELISVFKEGKYINASGTESNDEPMHIATEMVVEPSTTYVITMTPYRSGNKRLHEYTGIPGTYPGTQTWKSTWIKQTMAIAIADADLDKEATYEFTTGSTTHAIQFSVGKVDIVSIKQKIS